MLTFTQTYILCLILIGLLGVYYVWSLNTNATKWYEIRNLEIERQTLRHEENLLSIKIAEIESLDSVGSHEHMRAMQVAEDREFLVVGDVYYTYRE